MEPMYNILAPKFSKTLIQGSVWTDPNLSLNFILTCFSPVHEPYIPSHLNDLLLPLHILQFPPSTSVTLLLPLSNFSYIFHVQLWFTIHNLAYTIQTKHFLSFLLIYSMSPPGRSNSHSKGHWWRLNSAWNHINWDSNHCFNISGDTKLGKIPKLISQTGIVINFISRCIPSFHPKCSSAIWLNHPTIKRCYLLPLPLDLGRL